MKMPWQRREERAAELDEEIRAHFEMAVRDRIARGESHEAAMTAARREFGNVAQVKEVTRDMWGGVWLERLAQDLRYAFRSLRHTPTFTLVAVVTLGLGIGANTAMFTVMNGVLMRPLAFPAPDRLFAPSYKPPPNLFSPNPGMYDRHYLAYETDTTVFERIATYSSPALTLTGAGDPVKVKTTIATPSFFGVLGVLPSIGRAFSSAEGEPGRDNIAVLSDALWRSRFGADRRIVGRSITLDGQRRTVIGVMPASFDFPAGSNVWVPSKVVPERGNIRLRSVVARLKPGVTREQALRSFNVRAQNFELPDGFKRSELIADVVPLKQVLVGDAQRPLLIFAGAVAFVLLIACANVANLLLMRVTSRDREMAVRGALGAGRWRLVRQLLTETFALTAMGAVLGLLIAIAGLRLLLALAPAGTIPRAESVGLDTAALAFTGGLSLLTAIVCGLFPALHATEERLRASLTTGARTIAGAHARLRSMLVVGEIALALVLLIGAGLLLRSFERMQSVQLGFDPTNVVAATLDLPDNAYRTAPEIHAFDRGVLASLRAIPGADAVGAVTWAPLDNMLVSGDFYLEDGSKPRGRWGDKISVSPGYFLTMGMRLRSGRDFTDDDRLSAPGVMIISQTIADKLWPKGDALGKRVAMSEQAPQKWLTIVGVVGDVVQSDVKNAASPAMYFPIEQMDRTFFVNHVTFAVRHSGNAAGVVPAVRQILHDADKNLAIGVVASMNDRVSSTTLQPRFQSRMLLTFSLIALLLAVIGIYGVLAYGVAQRLHEIGVRMALGAAPTEVMSIVLRRTVMLVVPGVAIGIGAAFALTRVLSKFLFQVTPTDPVTFTTVGVLLGVVALAAAYGPARRASRVDPMVALRPE